MLKLRHTASHIAHIRLACTVVSHIRSRRISAASLNRSASHLRSDSWGSLRGEIRRLAGRRWGDTSYLLEDGQEKIKMGR